MVTSLDFGTGRLWTRAPAAILDIPPAAAGMLSPATHCLYEWTDYWWECPGADRVRIGSTWQDPITSGLFLLRFENELGLTALQAFGGDSPVGAPLHVEVISRKFPDLSSHVTFLRSLLDDLFARAARLPLALAAPVGRAVVESLRPPSPIFTLHFLSQYAAALRAALAVIQASPHRQLRDRSGMVPIAEAAEADIDVLVGALRTPRGWVPAWGFPLAEKLGGRLPARVWQRLPEETYDTPENRFLLAALRAFLTAAEGLPAQPWWDDVPPDRRETVRAVGGLLRRVVAQPLFSEVGPQHHFPATSRVLLRRDGYRDVLALWQVFRHARRPLFAPLRHAMDVRDIATLYEVWAFFALVEEIAVAVEQTPGVELRGTDATGLGWNATARFGTTGSLVYNRSERSYSGILMRPDFTWVPTIGSAVALDAMFQLTRAEGHPDETAPAETRVTHDDLYRMHAYRDTLGVQRRSCCTPVIAPSSATAPRGTNS